MAWLRGLRVLLLGSVTWLAGCSLTSSAFNAYKIDVPQGNVVSQEMVAKLKVGMSRSQVRFVLGTPLITDMFHPNRWDYVYQYRQAGQLTEKRHVTLWFEGDVLQRVEDDAAAQPAEKPLS